jgi:hypothetical protein
MITTTTTKQPQQKQQSQQQSQQQPQQQQQQPSFLVSKCVGRYNKLLASGAVTGLWQVALSVVCGPTDGLTYFGVIISSLKQ